MKVTAERVIPANVSEAELVITLLPEEEKGFDDVVTVAVTIMAFMAFGWFIALLAILFAELHDITAAVGGSENGAAP